MTSCETCQAELSAALDGELEGVHQVVTLDHLVDCPGCRAFYRQGRALGGVLAAVDRAPAREPLPETMWQSIAHAAGLSGVRRWWRQTAPLQVAAAAAVVLLVLGAVWLLPPSSTPVGEQASLVADLDEVEVGARRGQMTDTRFISLAKELLEADHRYRQEIVELMTSVERQLDAERSTEESSGRSESEPASRSLAWDGLEGERSRADIRLRLW